MAKPYTETPVTSLSFGPRQPVTTEGVSCAAGLLNYYATKRAVTHIDTTCTLNRLPSLNPMNIFFPRAASGYSTIFYFPVWVMPEAATMSFAATVYCHATPAPTVRIRWNFDGSTATQDYTTANNGISLAKTFSVSGEGWVACTMEIMTVSTGATMTAATSAYVHSIRVANISPALASVPYSIL